ncbi:unnamed protein product [Triticum turgidum subsp. durum]|uniref:USP domain-containing protein n=1 Tax=Triticum turgidum subsp. durum TaxID=4567 RepID=A0A9R0UY75_TRITD|nr:unnamed protein product [Triticum turgidum subsp. durum]
MPVALPPPPEEKEQQQQQQPAADAIQLQPLESGLFASLYLLRASRLSGVVPNQARRVKGIERRPYNEGETHAASPHDRAATPTGGGVLSSLLASAANAQGAVLRAHHRPPSSLSGGGRGGSGSGGQGKPGEDFTRSNFISGYELSEPCSKSVFDFDIFHFYLLPDNKLDYVDTSCCSRNLICGESYYRVCVVHTVPLVLKLQKDDHTDACPVFSENFRWGRHQDAHEFLRCLLDKLDEASVPPRSPSSERPSSIVTQVFGGQLKSQLHCPECNYCSDRLEPFLDLNLEVIPMATVMDALKSFTKIEVFENYGCDGCKSRVNLEKQLKVEQAPEVLVIQLKRFQNFGSHITKIEDCMMYQEELDLNPFMSSPDNKPQKYDLYGVVQHEGAPSNGHYVCYIRSSRTNWFHFNDSKVMKINDVMALESEAYLLFYAKQGSSPWFSTLLKRKNNVSGDTEEGGYSSSSSEDDYYPEGLSWHNDGDKTRSATKEETDLQLRQIISMQKEKCGEREIEEKAKAEGDSSIQTTCPESLSWRKDADVKGSDDSPAGPLLGPAGSHSDNIAKGKRTYKAIVQEETTPDELLQHLKEMVPSIFAKALEGMHTSLALSEALKREHVVEMHNDDDDKTRSVRKRKWEWDNNLKVVEEEEEEEEEDDDDDDVEEEPYYYVYSD